MTELKDMTFDELLAEQAGRFLIMLGRGTKMKDIIFATMDIGLRWKAEQDKKVALISSTAMAGFIEERSQLNHAIETLRNQVELLRQNSADDIRAEGWTVAVHNDYRLHGVNHTFWLFTKGTSCTKGEGSTDAEALNQIRVSLRISQ